jgi:hypothetical protein
MGRNITPITPSEPQPFCGHRGISGVTGIVQVGLGEGVGRRWRRIRRCGKRSTKETTIHIRSLFLKLDLGNVPQDNRRVLAVLTYLRTSG